MRRALWIFLGLAVWGVAACSTLSTSSAQTTYQATPLKGDVRVTFSTTGEMVLIDITSPTGIGSAAIEKTSGQWPGKIVMRLHTQGLEQFTFRYGNTSIDLSVSSQGDHAVHEVVTQSGKTATINAGDPYWIAVTPEQNYFDLQAPADFLNSGENQFTIEWIDFYR